MYYESCQMFSWHKLPLVQVSSRCSPTHQLQQGQQSGIPLQKAFITQGCCDRGICMEFMKTHICVFTTGILLSWLLGFRYLMNKFRRGWQCYKNLRLSSCRHSIPLSCEPTKQTQIKLTCNWHDWSCVHLVCMLIIRSCQQNSPMKQETSSFPLYTWTLHPGSEQSAANLL